jgi:hypothetical protein
MFCGVPNRLNIACRRRHNGYVLVGSLSSFWAIRWRKSSDCRAASWSCATAKSRRLSMLLPVRSRPRLNSSDILCEDDAPGTLAGLRGLDRPGGALLAIGLYDRAFFSSSNLFTIIADTMTLFLMASGVTFVIMIGRIDLSVQSVASMSSCVLAVSLSHLGFAAVPLAILGGAAAGSLSTKLRIPSFIATFRRKIARKASP